MTEITRHRVPFHGTRATTGPLTWGQLEMWSEAVIGQEGVPTFANMINGGPLPPGTTVEAVLAALGRLIERHESLRTRYRLDPSGDPVQEVVQAGEAEFEVVAIAPDASAAEITGSWWPYLDQPYDLADGLPFRARIGTVEGEPVSILFGMSHLSSDFLGASVLYGELAGMLDGQEPTGPALQPVDLAELEGSDQGRRVLERAMGHWRDELSKAPSTMFHTPGGAPEEPRYWRGGIRSQVAARMLVKAAERTGIGTSYILLAAMAVLVGRLTGRDRCSVRAVASNRGRPEFRRAVGNLSQETPLVVDLGADTFQEVLEGARVASLNAVRHGRYDPRRVAAIVDAHAVELDVCFNDLWTPARGPVGPEEVPPALTSFEWEEKVDRASVSFFLEAFTVPDDPAAIRLSLFADTAHLPPDGIRAYLDTLERLLTVLAERDVRLDEIDPGALDPGATGPGAVWPLPHPVA
ncbi:condensation domain-containing protein [Actinomadura macra]|uniref:condensation domain-containing protein n=1 Tax=Actinomadura macra TaxID=46164 RepID=UPI00082A3765|nr:condensation domain-containing protein [Actinomadura macra]